MLAELIECRKTIARYQGAISRWCDLTGNAIDGTKTGSKQDAELDAFRRHLTELKSEKEPNWNF